MYLEAYNAHMLAHRSQQETGHSYRGLICCIIQSMHVGAAERKTCLSATETLTEIKHHSLYSRATSPALAIDVNICIQWLAIQSKSYLQSCEGITKTDNKERKI